MWLGDLCLWKKGVSGKSYCHQNEEFFDYHSISRALCGKEPDEFKVMYFNIRRLLVIQME